MQKRLKNRTNEQIRATEVRLVALPDGYTDGVYKISEALQIAKELGLDLIELSSSDKGTICKIMESSKFQYELKKKERDAKKNQKHGQLKEIGLSPNIGEHDLETKVKKSKEFLKDGDKVKASMLFKGRNIHFKDRGELVMLKFASLLSEFGVPESMPKMEGKKMLFIIKPLSKK
jgi:translation initiation factor IF-3